MSFALVSRAMRIPSQVGDVLILKTERGVKIHAVGRVTTAGQQDFHRSDPPPTYIVDQSEAIAAARTLVTPGRQMFLVLFESGTWSDIVP
jgi:hypothetical protein